MASRRSAPRRTLLPILLAVALAAEVAGLAAARSLVPASIVPASADVAIAGATGTPGPAADALDRAAATRVGGGHRTTDIGRGAAVPVEPSAEAAAEPQLAVPAVHSRARVGVADRPRPELTQPTRSTTATPPTAGSMTRYRGTNHVWIPALGIDRSVTGFSCARSRPPDNLVYRWGCAGSNNVYLFGHAYSVFKPLHDAYVSGRLAKGMAVHYADGNGTVRTYAVAWWKVVRPTPDAKWAWAAQPTPSMTLQTCVGQDSEFRLMVRLLEVR